MSSIQRSGSNTTIQSTAPVRSNPATASEPSLQQPADPQDRVTLGGHDDEAYHRVPLRQMLSTLRQLNHPQPQPEPSQADKLRGLQEYNRRMYQDYLSQGR